MVQALHLVIFLSAEAGQTFCYSDWPWGMHS